MWITSSPLLRQSLLADALASGGSGALLAVGHAPLAAWLGLPASLLLGAGLFTLAYGLFVAVLGTRVRLPRPLVVLVVVGNLAWAAGSVALLFDDRLSPTGWGQAYVIAQAAIVAALAELQFFGLRRSAPAGLGGAAALS